MWENLPKEQQDALLDCLDIFDKWAKYGSIMGQIKDKYGQTRWYAYIGTRITLNTIFYPRYMFNQMPKWTYWFDYNVFQPIVNFLFGKLFIKWQVFCYVQAYKECFKKYPKYNFHSIDHTELIEKYIPPEMWREKLKHQYNSRYCFAKNILKDIERTKDNKEYLEEILTEWKKLLDNTKEID